MKDVAILLYEMVSSGIIKEFAVFGAIAQIRYTEAVATMCVDVSIATPEQKGLDVLRPIYEFCESRGCRREGEAIRVGDWPVRFVPAFDTVTREALRLADAGSIEGVRLRVVRADYLAAIALSVGRAKDYARILALLESGAVTAHEVERLASSLGFDSEWKSFRGKFLEQ